MAWFALVPLLKALENESPFNAFRLGFIAGLAHYLTLVYWIVTVLATYGGLNVPVSLGIMLLLCLYLSLYPALFALLFNYLKDSRLRSLLTAGVWVSLEYMRAHLLTGFPWCLLGYSQFRHPILIQIADTVGVYGLSFLIVGSNALIYALIFNSQSKSRKRYLGLEISVMLLLFVLTLTYGNYRLSEYEGKSGEGKSVRAAIVQGNVDQSVKWNPAFQEETLDRYRRMTLALRDFRPRIIVWPETAVPFFFQDNSHLTEEVLDIARESGAYLIFGSPAYKEEMSRIRYYNRVFLLSPMGRLAGHYDKVHLVPFGEYVPLKRFLPFVHRLVPAAGDFDQGKEVSPLKIPGLSAGALVCYEAIFPEISREHVKKGANILVNLTNDAWFGMTSAPYQHLIMSLFRAVETRRPLIRAANTGFSAFIDKRGEIISRGDLFREEVLMEEVGLGDNTLTFYTRYGDVFAYLLILICLIKFFSELCYHLFRRD